MSCAFQCALRVLPDVLLALVLRSGQRFCCTLPICPYCRKPGGDTFDVILKNDFRLKARLQQQQQQQQHQYQQWESVDASFG